MIRVWIEEDTDVPLRARITQTLDISTGGEATSAAAGEQAILREVDDWLRRLRESSVTRR